MANTWKCPECGRIHNQYDSCWYCEMRGEKLRQEILKCGYIIGTPIDACQCCDFRFKCHTVKMKRYHVMEYYSGYDSCIVYATNKDEARELVWDNGRDVYEEGNSNSWGDDTDVEELDQNYYVRPK